ncbi:hypothetical protein K505DRAFT_374005 [Melanomma pulvis-pyrius CBS 109.77]|uniref:Swi5-domain-containing protein n=1 Tax=Melanomma pulvis-pyrius CBS 109.77 TaxID=1314802 RepID=A0A6A6XI36_9PLEO|nr:hypothetical protein K505DRAFT_374005 [Melanomma pulvis-pyrius CBS 109.77]
MAIKEGVAEIPDSEDELLTSSPVVIEDGIGQLAPNARDTLQTVQDALQDVACSYQASVEHASNSASTRDERFVAEKRNASEDIDMANTRSNNAPTQQNVKAEAKPEHRQEPETAHNNGISGEQPIDTDSKGRKSRPSTQQQHDQGIHPKHEGSLEPNPPYGDVPVRAWDEHQGSVKEMQLDEGPKGVSLKLSESAELQPPVTMKFNAEGSSGIIYSLGQCRSGGLAETETTTQGTIDPKIPIEIDSSLTKVIDSADGETGEIICISSPETPQQQQKADQRSNYDTKSPAVIPIPPQERQREGEEQVHNHPISPPLVVSVQTILDPSDAMDVELEISYLANDSQGIIQKGDTLVPDSQRLIHNGKQPFEIVPGQSSIEIEDGTMTEDAMTHKDHSSVDFNSKIPTTDPELHSAEEESVQRTVDVEARPTLMESNILQGAPLNFMLIQGTGASANSTSEKKAISAMDMETSSSTTIPEPEYHPVPKHMSAVALERGAEQNDQMDIDASYSTLERTSMPETSAKEATIPKAVNTSSIDLPKKRDSSEIQTDPQDSRKSPQLQPQLSSLTKAIPSPKKASLTKPSQEAMLTDLRAQRAALIASLAALPIMQDLVAEDEDDHVPSRASDELTDADVMKAANKIVKTHIKLLHEYNEIKDVGQGLMGLIADSRGVRIVEVQDEFGIESKD